MKLICLVLLVVLLASGHWSLLIEVDPPVSARARQLSKNHHQKKTVHKHHRSRKHQRHKKSHRKSKRKLNLKKYKQQS